MRRGAAPGVVLLRKPGDWTPDEDAILRRIWTDDQPFKMRRAKEELPHRTRGAIGAHAFSLSLEAKRIRVAVRVPKPAPAPKVISATVPAPDAEAARSALVHISALPGACDRGEIQLLRGWLTFFVYDAAKKLGRSPAAIFDALKILAGENFKSPEPLVHANIEDVAWSQCSSSGTYRKHVRRGVGDSRN